MDPPDSWQEFLFDDQTQLIWRKWWSEKREQHLFNEDLPPLNQMFNAFNAVHFSSVKVVILGQDPYHGLGQADGYAFSVAPDQPLPPSLVNIFKELSAEFNVSIPKSGHLAHWANQGVLLLNSAWSVPLNSPGAYMSPWKPWSDLVLKQLSLKSKGIVFMLWGGYAQKKASLISDNHLILRSGHPSPLSANRGYWFGNNHFKMANEYLIQQGKEPINWVGKD